MLVNSDSASSFSKGGKSLILFGNDWVSAAVNSFLHTGLRCWDTTWAKP